MSEAVTTLKRIVDAGEAGTFAAKSVIDPLRKKKLVEVNTSVKNEAGHYAVRATKLGVETAAKLAENFATKLTRDNPLFEIETVEVQQGRKFGAGGGAPRKYPFDVLEVGQSFFVPDSYTGSDKTALQFMQGAVQHANIHYSEEIDGETRVNKKGREVAATRQLRKFVLRRPTASDPKGTDGIRVLRIL